MCFYAYVYTEKYMRSPDCFAYFLLLQIPVNLRLVQVSIHTLGIWENAIEE